MAGTGRERRGRARPRRGDRAGARAARGRATSSLIAGKGHEQGQEFADGRSPSTTARSPARRCGACGGRVVIDRRSVAARAGDGTKSARTRALFGDTLTAGGGWTTPHPGWGPRTRGGGRSDPAPLDEVAGLAPGELRCRRRSRGHRAHRRLPAGAPGISSSRSGAARDFADDALAAGAAAALVPRRRVRRARVARPRRSGTLSVRESSPITGSIAKTSTKDILAALVRPARAHGRRGGEPEQRGRPAAHARPPRPGHRGLRPRDGHARVGQIAELCDIAAARDRRDHEDRPRAPRAPRHRRARRTGEGGADRHALPPGGMAVVPAGDPLLEPYLDREDIQVIRFGPDGDVELVSFAPRDDASTVVVSVFGERLSLELPFSSRYNAENVLAALGAYRALGFPLAKRAQARREDHAVPLARGGAAARRRRSPHQRRLQREPALDDRGARAPRRARRRPAHRRGARRHGGARRRTRPRTTARSARSRPRTGVAALVAVGPLARGYLEGARGVHETRWAHRRRGRAAARDAPCSGPGDCILLKGSRAMGLEILADALAVELPAA